MREKVVFLTQAPRGLWSFITHRLLETGATVVGVGGRALCTFLIVGGRLFAVFEGRRGLSLRRRPQQECSANQTG